MQDPDFNTPVNKPGLQQLGFPMAAGFAPGQPRLQVSCNDLGDEIAGSKSAPYATLIFN